MTEWSKPGHDRVYSRIQPEPNSGCWLWEGPIDRGGYGMISLGKNVTSITHRVVYELERGPIPEGLHLDHLCRNRACCNPDHLEPVTRRENAIRGMNKHRDGQPCRICGTHRRFDVRKGSGRTHSRCWECAKRAQQRYYAKAAGGR